MIKKLWKNESGTVGLVTGVVMLIVTLAVLIIGLPILQGISDSAALDAGTYASGVWTTGSANVTTGEYTNITAGGMTYAFYFNNSSSPIAPSGYILVDVSGGWDTSNLVHTNLTTAINDNATLAALITAVNTTTGSTNTTTITADVIGVTANGYGTIDGSSSGSWVSATMTGGTDADSLYTSSETVIDTTDSSYSMASVIPTLVIAIPVLGALFALIFIFAGRRD